MEEKFVFVGADAGAEEVRRFVFRSVRTGPHVLVREEIDPHLFIREDGSFIFPKAINHLLPNLLPINLSIAPALAPQKATVEKKHRLSL